MATQRGYYRAEMLRAIENIGMALTHLVRIRDAYSKDYPQIASFVQQIGDALVMAAENIQKVHDSV